MMQQRTDRYGKDLNESDGMQKTNSGGSAFVLIFVIMLMTLTVFAWRGCAVQVQNQKAQYSTANIINQNK